MRPPESDTIVCATASAVDWTHLDRSFFRPYTTHHLELNGNHASVWLRPGERMLTLGRSPEASLAVQAPEVSRIHAIVRWRKGHFVLRDISTFGTWVYFSGQAQPLILRGNDCQLAGWGRIGLGGPLENSDSPSVAFGVKGG